MSIKKKYSLYALLLFAVAAILGTLLSETSVTGIWIVGILLAFLLTIYCAIGFTIAILTKNPKKTFKKFFELWLWIP